jgi:hypothetical protein
VGVVGQSAPVQAGTPAPPLTFISHDQPAGQLAAVAHINCCCSTHCFCPDGWQLHAGGITGGTGSVPPPAPASAGAGVGIGAAPPAPVPPAAPIAAPAEPIDGGVEPPELAQPQT